MTQPHPDASAHYGLTSNLTSVSMLHPSSASAVCFAECRAGSGCWGMKALEAASSSGGGGESNECPMPCPLGDSPAPRSGDLLQHPPFIGSAFSCVSSSLCANFSGVFPLIISLHMNSHLKVCLEGNPISKADYTFIFIIHCFLPLTRHQEVPVTN